MVHTDQIARRLTRRYILALTLLGILATGALVTAEVVILRQAGTSALVDIAGRQRMLSQRAVVFATRLTASHPDAQRTAARDQLATVVDELERANAILTKNRDALWLRGGKSPALRNVYFGGQDAVEPLLQAFLTAARALIAKAATGPVAVDNPDLAIVDDLGPTRLLAALDRAVAGEYEAESAALVERMLLFEVLIWLAGLLVLLLTGIFVFAPMVRRLKENLAEVRAATTALKESEERFALAARGSSVGIRDHLDLKSDEESWTSQFYRLLGFDPGVLSARRSTFHALLHPDDRALVENAIGAHLHEHTPLRIECRLQHKMQGYRWFLLTGQATWTLDGTPRRLITSVMDINDRKRAEQMKSEFVSTAAHELRTPLTSISGALELLPSRAAGELSQKGQRLLQIAQENCERLACLINDLLDVEKIEAGRIAFDFHEENLASLLTQAKEQNQIYAQKQGATIVLVPPSLDIAVDVDTVRFAQVMSNLISNAAKYSPPGGKITVSARVLDGMVRIAVRDRGPGIPEEMQHRVFQRFAQAQDNAQNQKPGTGLGLSIAKAIVEAHGGDIGFDSKVGEGTTFYFDLPASHDSVGGAHEPKDTIGLPKHQRESARSARILLVESELAQRPEIERQIGDIGELTTVSSCLEAARILSRRAFDLVVVGPEPHDRSVESLVASDRGRPLPNLVLYGPGGDWPDSLAALASAQADEGTLRQAVLDELRDREGQLVVRFKKSA